MERSDEKSKRGPGQWNSFALYLMSLAVMISLYSLYAKFLVPLIEGPPNIVQRRVVDPGLQSLASGFDKTELLAQLASDAWERNDCKTLVTSQGTILFKDIERLEGGYLEIFPFTLVGTGESESDELVAGPAADTSSSTDQPLTFLRCLRGARVKFDRSISEALVGKAKMESAQLIGQVDIKRTSSQPDANDGFWLSTSNIQIEKQQIYTIEDVTFQFGSNHGRGKNLSIDLSHESNVNQITGDFSSIQGVKRIELAYLDYIRLQSADLKSPNEVEPQDFGEFPDALELSASAREGSDPDSGLAAGSDDPVNVRCRGPLVMNMDARTATLRDHVTVDFENEFRDRILCDELVIGFDEELDAGDASVVAAGPMSSRKPGKLKLKQLVAIGNPATILSTKRETKITGRRLSYDTLTNVVIAESAPGKQPVIIVSSDFHVTTERIDYQLGKQRKLGRIRARGPGQLLRVANDQQQEFFIQWSDQLLVEPLENATYQVSLIGDAYVRNDNATHLKSQRINLLLQEQEVSERLADGQLQQQTQYLPLRLIAQQNVQLESPTLTGTTQRLTATWPVDSVGMQFNSDRNRAPQLSYSGSITVQKPVIGHPDERPIQPNPSTSDQLTRRHNLQPIRRDRQVRLVDYQRKNPWQAPRKSRFRVTK